MNPVLVHLLDLVGVAVFAASGALVASRKKMDVIGFALLATLTGIGGGTVRDLIIDRPVFWLLDQSYLAVCVAIALASFFLAHLIGRRYIVLLWADAIGLAAYGVLGAHIARSAGAGVLPAVALGMMTATFGGLLRDVVSRELPLILKTEVYATAALLAAGLFVGARELGLEAVPAAAIGFAGGFAVRAGGIIWHWSLPRYRPREGREY